MGPSELGRICAEIRRSRPLATTTVATMLSVMLEKRLLSRKRSRRGYLWSARVDRDATAHRLVDRLIDRVFDGSAELLVAHLVESQKLSAKDRQRIVELLERGAARSPRRAAPGRDDT
jgi:predicted transcriptional regulator